MIIKPNRFIGIIIMLMIMRAQIQAQESRKFELTGQLNPDPAHITMFKRTIALSISDGGTGPYQSIMTGDTSLTTHTIFRPADLSVFGGTNKLPVLAYGNGGCMNSPDQVLEVLSEIASHGFLVIAIGPVKNAKWKVSKLKGLLAVDSQEANRLVRSHASEWHTNTQKVGLPDIFARDI
jgi:hypothetical protein